MSMIGFFRSVSQFGGEIDENSIIPPEGFESLMPSVVEVNLPYKQYTYRKFFVKNISHKLIRKVKVYIAEQTPCPDDDIAITLGTDTDTVQEASTYTYYQPYTKDSALTLAEQLAPGEKRAVWIKRTVSEFARPFSDNYYVIAVFYSYIPDL